MGDVVMLDVETTLPLPPERILEAAKGRVERVLVLGYEPDGSFYFAGSHSDIGEAMLMFERAKIILMAEFDDLHPAA